ncbi:MAG TPA: hypothetical protein VNO52_00690, partial [Methylomirabilota bacterium]|nr:hypothetical protein [Methylomirabilota bacterium]
PAIGMQAAFAAEAAGADDEARRRALTAAMRGSVFALSVIWLAVAAWCVVRQDAILAAYGLDRPALLWLMLLICLVTLLTPVFAGSLQGRQDFLCFGGATLLNGFGRFAVLLIGVKGLGWGALGGLAGVLAGSVAVLALVGWRTRALLCGTASAFQWRPWLKRLVPVTLGLGALTVIMQADALIVREKLLASLTQAEIDGYSAVRKIAQAMVFLVGAMVSVMYPKVARSFQRAERTDVLRLTLALTALLGVLGATLATLFPELPLRVLSLGRLTASKALVPAYCWALVPLALANVLVWNLLAREQFGAVPWMVAIAIGYRVALEFYHQRLTTVIGLVGLAATLLCLVGAAFAWSDYRRHRTEAAGQP